MRVPRTPNGRTALGLGVVLLTVACAEPGAGPTDVLEIPVQFSSHKNGDGGEQFQARGLRGSEEVPPVDSDGEGKAEFVLSPDETTLDFDLRVENTADVTQAHIHLGPRGQNGPVVVFLFGPVFSGVEADGRLAEGTVTEADIIARPTWNFDGTLASLIEEMRAGNTYVNVHTVAHPPGEIRAQISGDDLPGPPERGESFEAKELTGSQEVPPVESDGEGKTEFVLSSNGTRLDFELQVKNVPDVTQAHVHLGPRGQNGPVVAFLFGPEPGGVEADGTLAEGSLTDLDVIARPEFGFAGTIASLVEEMRRGHTYVNVHTLTNPPGEIRGQVGDDDGGDDDAPTVVSTTPANLATDVPVGSNIIINFGEAVHASGSPPASFTIQCPVSTGNLSYALSASPASSFTLDPNADLPAGTLCTVTVIAAQVTDADAVDPPDNMAENFAFSFTTTTAPPLNDGYDAIGNVGINVPDGAGDLTSNDPPGSVVTKVQGGTDLTAPFTETTDQGGSVTVHPNGSFSYDPPAGFEGADGFAYFTNGSSATVSIAVGDVIWFIDNSAGSGGDGRLGSPFNSLAGYQGTAADDPGDVIYVHTGSVAYTGGITLENSQVLIGQGASSSIDAVAGLSLPPFSRPLPTTGGSRPVIEDAGGNGIDVASNNTIRGLNVGATSGFGVADKGVNVGTLTINEASITGTGGGFKASSGGTLAVSFDELTAIGGTRGIDLNQVSGTFAHSTGSISGSGAEAVRISGSTLTFTYDGNITNTANGIELNANLGTMSFGGSLNLSTGNNTAFTATGAGVVNATGTGSTISNTSGPAVAILGTDIGTGGVTFQSVSSSGGNKGIVLSSAGSGGFTVTGTGNTDGSGGTIQNKTARGIDVVGTDNVSFSNMNFTNASTTNGADPSNPLSTCSGNNNLGCNAAIHLGHVTGATIMNAHITGSNVQQGINGLNVEGFTLGNSVISGVGDQVNEGGVRLFNLTGTVNISGSTVEFSSERNVYVRNDLLGSPTLAMTFTGNIIRDTQSSGFGADGLEVELLNTTRMDLDVTNSSFFRNRSNGLQVIAGGTSVANSVDVTGNDFDTFTGIGRGIDLATDNSAVMRFNVNSNGKIYSDGGTALNVVALVSSSIEGRIQNNVDIQTDRNLATTPAGGMGIDVHARDNSTVVVDISNNTVSNIFADAGIRALSRSGTGTLDATISGNSVTLLSGSAFPLYGFWVQAEDNNTTCANVTNNSVTVGNGIAAFGQYTTAAGATVELEGFTVNATNTWNANGNLPVGSVSSSNNGTLTGGTCTTPGHPLP